MIITNVSLATLFALSESMGSDSIDLTGSDFENILINNCADHSIAIMDAAKILTDEQVAFFSTPGTLLTPSTVSLMAKSIPNAVQIKLPHNGVISPALHYLLSTFDKN